MKKKKSTKQLTQEELKDELRFFYLNLIKRNLHVKDMVEKYQFSQFAAGDLSHLTEDEFERLIDNLPYIEEQIKKKRLPVKIAAELGIGTHLVGYIANSLVPTEERVDNPSEYSKILMKEIERVWKKTKTGESIDTIKLNLDLDRQEVKYLVDNLEKVLDNKKEYFKKASKKTSYSEEVAKQGLKKKFNFDDDTIEYVLHGKEIGKEVELGEL